MANLNTSIQTGLFISQYDVLMMTGVNASVHNEKTSYSDFGKTRPLPWMPFSHLQRLKTAFLTEDTFYYLQ